MQVTTTISETFYEYVYSSIQLFIPTHKWFYYRKVISKTT